MNEFSVKTGRDLLQEIYLYACSQATVENVMQKNFSLDEGTLTISGSAVSLDSFRRIYVVGAGIAAFPMAQFLETLLGNRIYQGTILVPPGIGGKLDSITVKEVTSPLIDQPSRKALQDLLYLINNAQETDLVILLLSKGAGEILELLHEDISFNDYSLLLKKLYSAGARNEEIEAIKMHLSQIKGGQLLRFSHPATTISVILSDEPGGDIARTYLAPTAPDPSTFKYCRQVLLRYKIPIKMPPKLLNHFNNGIQGKVLETVKPDDPMFSRSFNFMLHDCCTLAADALQGARNNDISRSILSTRLHGSPQQMGVFLGSILRDCSEFGIPLRSPSIIIGTGRVDSSDENRLQGLCTLAMSAALEIEGHPNAHLLAASSFQFENRGMVGCMIDGTTAARIRNTGTDPIDALMGKKELQVLKEINSLIETPAQINDCGDLFLMSVT